VACGSPQGVEDLALQLARAIGVHGPVQRIVVSIFVVKLTPDSGASARISVAMGSAIREGSKRELSGLDGGFTCSSLEFRMLVPQVLVAFTQ
jgi:hypothetical protein